jgi:hypothetical protein
MKRNSFLKLVALGLLSVSAMLGTGCEKRTVMDVATEAQSTPTVSFKKQLTLDRIGGKTVMLEVGATDQALLDQLEAKQFGVAVNGPTSEVTETSHSHAKQGQPNPVLPTRFVTVQVLGAYGDQEISNYTLTFDAGLQDLMRREKVGMRIILAASQHEEPSGKTAGWWYRTPYCGKVVCNGDGGQIQTGVITYRPTSTGQLPVHTFYFFNSAPCTKCAHGVNYLDDIWVFQDVLTSVVVYTGC